MLLCAHEDYIEKYNQGCQKQVILSEATIVLMANHALINFDLDFYLINQISKASENIHIVN